MYTLLETAKHMCEVGQKTYVFNNFTQCYGKYFVKYLAVKFTNTNFIYLLFLSIYAGKTKLRRGENIFLEEICDKQIPY